MKGEILAAGFLPEDAMRELESRYRVHHYYAASNPQALLQQVSANIVCMVGTSHAMMSAELINAMPNLKQISIYGTGYEKVDRKAASDRNIIITNTPDVMTSDVADLALGLILTVVREMVAADSFVRSGRMGKQSMPFAHSLNSKKLGIVGLGNIGSEVAIRAEPFGLDISYHSRKIKPDAPYRYYDNLKELATDVDILVLAVPGGEETLHMIDAEILAALGPKGTLINIGRGSLVDEPALVHALENGIIRAAGLDVFEDLANPSAALLGMPNVVLSPHRGSATHESRSAMARIIVGNVDAFFAGHAPVTPV